MLAAKGRYNKNCHYILQLSIEQCTTLGYEPTEAGDAITKSNRGGCVASSSHVFEPAQLLTVSFRKFGRFQLSARRFE